MNGSFLPNISKNSPSLSYLSTVPKSSMVLSILALLASSDFFKVFSKKPLDSFTLIVLLKASPAALRQSSSLMPLVSTITDLLRRLNEVSPLGISILFTLSLDEVVEFTLAISLSSYSMMTEALRHILVTMELL